MLAISSVMLNQLVHVSFNPFTCFVNDMWQEMHIILLYTSLNGKDLFKTTSSQIKMYAKTKLTIYVHLQVLLA